MKHILSLVFLASFIVFTSCSNGDQATPADEGLAIAEAAFNQEQSKATASRYIGALQKKAVNDDMPLSEKQTLLNKGISLAKEYKIIPLETSLLHSLIKQEGTSTALENIMSLGTLLKASGKGAASNTLFYAYASKSDGQAKADGIAAMTAPIENIDTFINVLRQDMFVNTNKFGLNENSARAYVDACEAYAMGFPENDNSALYLFQGAEVAKTLRSFNKSFALFDWILDKYPNHAKAPTSLFLKGFIMENEVKNVEGARELYNEFISKYPNHELADDVQFLIDNLGKSDEEILKMIEAKRDQKNAEG